jgi:predicted nucleotidyltransferase
VAQQHDLKNSLIPRTAEIIEKAEEYSQSLIDRIKIVVDNYCSTNSIDLTNCCFIVVGSVGRKEALGASDIDLIPVFRNSSYSEELDKALRKHLSEALHIKVSAGQQLTKAININELVDPKSIGSESDSSAHLTRRILILTEGLQAGGNYDIQEVKTGILKAYDNSSITKGRYILSLSNDLARYYRTLCIEYKAKIDVDKKDWCTRNTKLRHSRKLWYFATMVSLISTAIEHPVNAESFNESLLKRYSLSPIRKLFDSVEQRQYYSVAKLTEYFSWFIQFMSSEENRKALEAINFDERYNKENFIYYAQKLNSDMLHSSIIAIINEMDYNKRQKLTDWFLL